MVGSWGVREHHQSRLISLTYPRSFYEEPWTLVTREGFLLKCNSPLFVPGGFRVLSLAIQPSGIVQVEVVVEAQVDSGEIRGIVLNPGTAQDVPLSDKPLDTRVSS